MSNLPTVNAPARVYDQSGKPIHKAVVTMRLTTVERYSGYIVPREVRAETDAAGKADVYKRQNQHTALQRRGRARVRRGRDGVRPVHAHGLSLIHI